MAHNHKGVAGWPVYWESQDYACKCVKHAALDFTQQTSLHGLRYTSDKTISRAERYSLILVIQMLQGKGVYSTNNTRGISHFKREFFGDGLK